MIDNRPAPRPGAPPSSIAFGAMFAGTFLASTSSTFIVTILALHVYRLTGEQTLAVLVPVTQWAAAIPCVFAVARLGRLLTPSRLMACTWVAMGAMSLLSHAFTAALWPLLVLLCTRGGADFLAKNARAQWLKAAIEGRHNPERCGSLIATSQYLGTLMGGLGALAVAGHWGVHQALNVDALLCTCAALLAMRAADGAKAAPPGDVQAAGTGWIELYRVLGQRPALGMQFVALVGFAGLFQGYHQAAKVGLSGALPPLRPGSVPGILQATAGLGIVIGAMAGGARALNESALAIAACAAGAAVAMMCAAGLTGIATWGVLTTYFSMMLLFEIGFTLASNRLLIALPRAQIPAMHSSSYVMSCAAMIATSMATARAFERLSTAAAAVTVLVASGAAYAAIALTIHKKRVSIVPPDVC